MKSCWWIVTLLLGIVACGSPTVENSQAADDKVKVIDLDGLKSQAPAEWKFEEPSNRMRFAQFRLPAKGGDKEDAELVIFRGISGSSKANVQRWKDQFLPPEGKTIDEVSKVEEMKIGKNGATYLDVTGTYKFKFPPFDPNAREQRKENYRLLGIHFEAPENVYHIKLTGPAKTVEAYKKGFDDWFKAFK